MLIYRSRYVKDIRELFSSKSVAVRLVLGKVALVRGFL